ncbi:polyprenyl diphosphate synthase [Candidatus Cardinium hertigii]|uniref:Isoprenyl transferase n=1 Tax=Candidatus Cardinium hertigii TaxID=247481 RepID=A0A3N2QBD4_9BACT|nr:polyprenyl diphosphate synthase [Candidatus Cardinium hertigii]ROT47136.1 di-trans,poly-cis-decaprenylcistransferase [Candidatus Cardinium hertigii]
MELSHLQKKPKHIGIIMDGNGRWGKKEAGDRSYGHENAKKAVAETISGCLEQEIPYLTIYAFSTENWGRPAQEVNTIFNVIAKSISENLNQFTENNIKFRVVGDSSGIPSFCWDQLKNAIDLTKNHTKLHLTVAINYGGRAETIAAAETMVNDFLIKIVNDFLSKGLSNDTGFGSFIKFVQDYRAKITPAIYKKYLYTSELPSVDLLIRTGGKKRMSNFLPWQCAYSELYFTDLFWPTFKKEHLMEALAYFQKQHRTFGEVT